MARTYPAKRARIAKGVIATCPVCGDLITDGHRVVGNLLGDFFAGTETFMHARCADAGEALP
ncbi:hypothetical protein GS504_24310 [Rhodococcus hoagii]|nr:hypothetical protein [Prescottella equi]NKS60579.1 hypothetical protein [Prescottella equi]NKW17058.1 hypothetical protein [Prescottella equi]NKZ94860.1 hypothetical protein [Prescottella equi]